MNITGLPATLPTSTTWTKLGSEVSLSNEVSLSSEVSLSNVSPSTEVSLSNDTIYQINGKCVRASIFEKLDSRNSL